MVCILSHHVEKKSGSFDFLYHLMLITQHHITATHRVTKHRKRGEGLRNIKSSVNGPPGPNVDCRM